MQTTMQSNSIGSDDAADARLVTPKKNTRRTEQPEQTLACCDTKREMQRMRKENESLRSSCKSLKHQLLNAQKELKKVAESSSFRIDALQTEIRDSTVSMRSLVTLSDKKMGRKLEAIKALTKVTKEQATKITKQKKALQGCQLELDDVKARLCTKENEVEKANTELATAKAAIVRLRRKLISRKIELREQQCIETTSDENECLVGEGKLGEGLNESKDVIEIPNMLQTESPKKVEIEAENKRESIKALQQELEGREKSNQAAAEFPSNERDEHGVEKKIETNQDRPSRRSLMRWKSKSSRTRDSLLGSNPQQAADTVQPDKHRIASLERASENYQATISQLRSDFVRLSSHYKEELHKSKSQIKKLLVENSEYSAKVSGLEAGFRAINAEHWSSQEASEIVPAPIDSSETSTTMVISAGESSSEEVPKKDVAKLSCARETDAFATSKDQVERELLHQQIKKLQSDFVQLQMNSRSQLHECKKEIEVLQLENETKDSQINALERVFHEVNVGRGNGVMQERADMLLSTDLCPTTLIFT